jgi:hypothetical protein
MDSDSRSIGVDVERPKLVELAGASQMTQNRGTDVPGPHDEGRRPLMPAHA